ncbi:MAG TPA: hypothetical protein EYO20_04385, partial [Gemmatimonadetes bacterium]|nr:hypothetical protein [Gemmatimonadota bacterium]
QGAGTTHQISSSAILSGDNTWHQAKVVYNQGTLELWLDQILVGSISSINISEISNNGNIEIGGFTYGGGNQYLPGLINNVKLINNQNDIIDFRFQAGSGTVLNDFSGHSNNGTINGATWSTDVTISVEEGFYSTYTFNVADTVDAAIAVSLAAAAAADQADNASTALSSYQVVYNGIAPDTPTNFSVAAGDAQITTNWSTNDEGDFAVYRIYGGGAAAPTTAVDSTASIADSSLSITDLSNYSEYFYRMTAVDTAGNESPYTSDIAVIPYALENSHSIGGGTVSIGELPALLSDSSFTYSFWLKLDEMPGQSTRLFGNNNDALDFIWQSDGSVHFMSNLPDYHNFDTGNENYFFSTGTWYHVAFVRSFNASINVYVNGELLVSADDSGEPATLSIPVLYANDYIDEFQIWNRALNAQEITENYDAITAPPASGLVLYWRLEEGTGNIAYDLSGKRNHGYITNGIWSTEVKTFYPVVRLSAAVGSYTNSSPIALTAAFTRSVTGFTTADITVTNGTIDSLSGSGKNYTFNITPTAEGTVTIEIAAGAGTDVLGNSNLAAATLSFIYDNTSPTAAITSSVYPLTKISPVPFNVTFSEPVTGFTEDDIALSHGTLASHYSLSFDGDGDYIYVGTPTGMSPTGDHTFMFWVKNNTPACSFGGLVGSMSDPGGTNQNLHYGFRGCGGLAANGYSCPDGNCMGMDFSSNELFTSSYQQNNWTHWVLTYDAISLERTIYKNGQIMAQAVAPSGYTGNLDIVLGATGGGNSVISFLTGN